MPSKHDWVVCRSWGTQNSLVGTASTCTPLIDAPDIANIDPNVVETDDDDLFIERIVGSVHWFINETPTVSWIRVHWRILPLGLDETAGGIEQPWAAFDGSNPDQANIRFWDDRHFQYAGPPIHWNGPMEVGDPHGYAVDIHPRQWVGRGRRLWPAFCIENETADDIYFMLYLRLLVKYT